MINDGSIALSGLSYAGEDKEDHPKFDKIQCVDLYQLEFCTVPRDGVKNWNAMTVEWLRHYVFERIKPEKGHSSTAATMITNLVSGFWHGFYPTYYNTFFFLAIVAEIGKDVYRIKHLFNWVPSLVSAVLRNILIMGSLNYLATGMIFLEFDKAFQFYKNFKFFGHITMIGVFLSFRFVIVPMFKKKRKGAVTETKTKRE
mmetsp:Transcript_25430/g.28246  ORF Transcript_25430/g.28246 Transcript_25430/m.28246 type:complete len:200 (+) Transcript_25430:825-1424(+)